MAIVQSYSVLTQGTGRRDYSAMVEYSTAPVIRSYQDNFVHSANLAIPVNYTTGTATFTVGSTTVTGVGTAWVAGMIGRRIHNETENREEWFTIVDVPNATTITLDEEYFLVSAGTTGIPVAYTLGGITDSITISEDDVLVLFDFVATRPNNKLLRMLVDAEITSLFGQDRREPLIDKTNYQTVEVHINEGYGFSRTVNRVMFTLFNYDAVAESYANIIANGMSTTRQEFYLEA